MKPLPRRSLIVRVMLLSSLWVMVALISISYISAVFYIDANKRNFEQLLTAHLYTLIGAVSADSQGNLIGHPELGDIRYNDPRSGWYWDVLPLSSSLHGRLASPSLGTRNIAAPSEKNVPFDERYMRLYDAKSLDGEDMRVLESDVILGAGGEVARFRIMGNLTQVHTEFRQFRTTIRWYLLSLGVASLLINALIIFYALRPLGRIKKSLADIRAGRAQRIEGSMPIEVAPMAMEMNALIDNNQRIVERFRAQVGNLAHSLKTPLSVLSNEADRMKGEKAHLIEEQTELMQLQINHYLHKARIAAQRDSVVYRTEVLPVMERLCRVMRKLNPQLLIETHMTDNNIYFAGEQQDLEEILGNLLENAAKWAQSRIIVQLATGEENNFSITIDDDGPGLDAGDIDKALKRGNRLDETKPGTGLGLSIVHETVYEYGGTLQIERNEQGGLGVHIVLPQAPQ